jgi:glutamate dehydrogenase/leucine dehydrogenase
MTYKAAMAEMAWGGAKAVIVGDPARDKTPALLVAYARALDRIGRFRTGGDMGIDGHDVNLLAGLTRFMSHPPAGAGVGASDLTAIGLVAAVRATAARLDLGLPGLRIAVQGLGEVGSRLAKRLAEAGARLTVADLDPGRAERAVSELRAEAVAPGTIYDVECDIFSPNAAGGVLDDLTLPRLRCRAVVGGANEQLREPRHGDALHERGILYAPDYLVNAGGLLSLLFELGETDEAGIVVRVEGIGPRLTALFTRSQDEGVAPHRLADRIVEERLAAARAAEVKP